MLTQIPHRNFVLPTIVGKSCVAFLRSVLDRVPCRMGLSKAFGRIPTPNNFIWAGAWHPIRRNPSSHNCLQDPMGKSCAYYFLQAFERSPAVNSSPRPWADSQVESHTTFHYQASEQSRIASCLSLFLLSICRDHPSTKARNPSAARNEPDFQALVNKVDAFTLHFSE